MPRKLFSPSLDQRELVKQLVGFGFPEEDVCRVVVNPETGRPVDAKTLRKHFREELDTGVVVANAKVAGNLYKIATGEGQGAVTAAIFWLKTRAQWKEPDRDRSYGRHEDESLAAALAKLADKLPGA